MGRGLDLPVESDIVILHRPPMTPPEGDLWWSTVDFENFPRKRRHHALEGLMTGCKVGGFGAVEFIRSDDGVVCAHLEHVIRGLGRPTVDCEAVVGVVNGAPVG